MSLLEEKVHIFRELSDPEDVNPPVREGMLFRATPEDVTRGEPIITDAIREGEWDSMKPRVWLLCLLHVSIRLYRPCEQWRACTR